MEIFLGIGLGVLIVIAAAIARARFFDFPAQSPEDYTGHGPEFDIRNQLNGKIACEGVIYGPTGRVTSRFVAEFYGEWDGNEGRMSEHFLYDSGATQDREWRLSLSETGRIRADAADLLGVGSGQQSGSSVSLNYTIKLPDSAGGHALDVVDWMYLTENGVIINRSQFRKWGIKVAELVATMRPIEGTKQIPDGVRDAA